jgi:hypothetical protein
MRAGKGVTIVYDSEDMALPLGARKYQYWSNETSAFEQWCNDRRQPEPGGELQVVNRVRALIATRALTRYEIAPELGMSVATLQRRLREAGELSNSLERRPLRKAGGPARHRHRSRRCGGGSPLFGATQPAPYMPGMAGGFAGRVSPSLAQPGVENASLAIFSDQECPGGTIPARRFALVQF